MSENDNKLKKAYSLDQRHIDIIQAHATGLGGNASMALRNIINGWADMGSKQLSLDAAYDTILDVAKRIESMANRVTTNTDTRDELDGLTGRLLNAALYLDGARREVADRMRPEVTR